MCSQTNIHVHIHILFHYVPDLPPPPLRFSEITRAGPGVCTAFKLFFNFLFRNPFFKQTTHSCGLQWNGKWVPLPNMLRISQRCKPQLEACHWISTFGEMSMVFAEFCPFFLEHKEMQCNLCAG